MLEEWAAPCEMVSNAGIEQKGCFSTVCFSLTITLPGELAEKTRWWRDFMPLNAWHLKKGVKYSDQLYWGTIEVPSSVPTNWAWLTTAELFTMSAKHYDKRFASSSRNTNPVQI